MLTIIDRDEARITSYSNLILFGWTQEKLFLKVALLNILFIVKDFQSMAYSFFLVWSDALNPLPIEYTYKLNNA